MSKPRSARGPKHSSNNAIDLAAEAANMELKLMELKRAMDKEREKREKMTARPNGDFLWQNGSAGLLRGNYRAQQAAASGGGAGHQEGGGTHPQSGRAGSGHSQSRAHGAPAAAAAAATAGGHALPFKSPRHDGAPSSAAPHLSTSQRPAQHPPPPVEQPSISGSRIAVPPERAAAGTRGGSSSSARRAADVLAIHHDDSREVVEGMGCGTEADDGLAGGHFDEKDSHKSFLDALNEWRQGNKDPEDTASAPAVAARPSSSRPAAHAPGVVMEVQTEARPAAAAAPRPSSARPISFFDKLVINENSRHAGDAADGTAANSAKGGGGAAAPASSSRPPSAATAAGARQVGGTAAAAAPAKKVGQPDETAGGAAGSAAASAPASNDKLAMLARLEALEAQQDGSDDDDDDGRPRVAVLTSVTGRGLTKGTRLPDNIVVPESDNA